MSSQHFSSSWCAVKSWCYYIYKGEERLNILSRNSHAQYFRLCWCKVLTCCTTGKKKKKINSSPDMHPLTEFRWKQNSHKRNKCLSPWLRRNEEKTKKTFSSAYISRFLFSFFVVFLRCQHCVPVICRWKHVEKYSSNLPAMCLMNCQTPDPSSLSSTLYSQQLLNHALSLENVL